MDFDVPPSTADFEREVDSLFSSAETQRLLLQYRLRADGMDGDIRPLYRHLGAAGVLAPTWPARYGGRDADYTATVVLLEQMVRHGIPQNLYYISVQIVGSLVLAAGTEAQQRALLPRLARTDMTVCILFTEREHGSDLASVTTTAVRDGKAEDAGWLLNGRKTYNLKSAYADIALCAVRTGDAGNRYGAISLLLVPLDAPGVSVRPLPSLADEQFHDITFRDVRLPKDAVFGEVGAGWGLITRMFAAERSGVDYYARARFWLELVEERLTRAGRRPTDPEVLALAHHRARVAASRLLACRALQRLQDDEPDIADASMAKWHCSETAQAVAWWALDTLGAAVLTAAPGETDELLEAAYREAPGMTISGGASEVMLDIVSGARLFDDLQIGA
jgi:alkylation response protein AidB-like acyl-CoA dehydrogenase